MGEEFKTDFFFNNQNFYSDIKGKDFLTMILHLKDSRNNATSQKRQHSATNWTEKSTKQGGGKKAIWITANSTTYLLKVHVSKYQPHILISDVQFNRYSSTVTIYSNPFSQKSTLKSFIINFSLVIFFFNPVLRIGCVKLNLIKGPRTAPFGIC